MEKHEKASGFFSTVKDLLGLISECISAIVYQPIADRVLQNIETRIIKIERRIMSKISILLVICFGAIFLVMAIFSFLIEFFHWSKAAAYFAIGIIILLLGILLKMRESDR